MLKLRSIEVAGFGPFAEPQLLEFPDRPGVTVVYGENMRGKTTLLNAIRFAFFGKAVGRGSRTAKIHALSNRELAAQGQFGFSVALDFEHDGVRYELHRECRPRLGVEKPEGDADYDHDMLLRRGDAIVSQEVCDKTLQQVFPGEVSRFFLFDGELLQEYEELLSNESETGRRISAAIERILGVPILKRAKMHLTLLSEDADREAAAAASKNKKTEMLGNALRSAIDQKKAHQDELARLEAEDVKLSGEKADLERYLNSVKRYAAILAQRNEALAQREASATLELEVRADLQRAMSDAWRSLLVGRVQQARDLAQQDVENQVAGLKLDLRLQATKAGYCEICDRALDEETCVRLRASIGTDPGSTDSVTQALSRLNDLNRFQIRDVTDVVKQLTKRLQELRLEQATLSDRIGDWTSELSDADPETMRRSQASYAEITEKLVHVRIGIGAEKKKIDETDESIQRLNEKLAAAGVRDLAATQRHRSVLRSAADVFSAAVDRYKADLRQRVEASASKLFLAMTTEKKDYAGLTISENYGLTIRHRDGAAEDLRSAGAEHVVALALMGALQQNAPLRGPIVMDSPFGRLDEEHTSNVVRALPSMADQVVLLVFEAEIGRDRIRELLGPKLRREYVLDYVSARRTKLTPIR